MMTYLNVSGSNYSVETIFQHSLSQIVDLVSNFFFVPVGVSTQHSDFLKFLFELNQDFCVLPTFGVIPAFSALQSLVSGSVPGLSSINPARVRISVCSGFILTISYMRVMSGNGNRKECK